MSGSIRTRTLGIDLASQPRDTAACLIDWDQGGPSVISAGDLIGDEPLSDDALLKLIEGSGVEKVAIDAPFGWPVEFVDAVSGWRERSGWPVPPDDPAEDQRLLVLRETDREVLRVTGLPLEETEARRGKRPLSVTTDKLAYTAMRCESSPRSDGVKVRPSIAVEGDGSSRSTRTLH